MHIHCNEELMDQFDPEQQSKDSVASDCHSAILGSWYAGIVTVLDSEFLLLVHTKSLYSTLDLLDVPDEPLSSQSFINLRGKILEMLHDHYYLTDAQVEDLVRPFNTITYGRMEDKRMVRILNGIASAYQKRFFQARQTNSNGEVRLWELEDDLNTAARRNLGGASPAEILRELVWSGIN